MLINKSSFILMSCLFINACSNNHSTEGILIPPIEKVETQISHASPTKKLQLKYAYKEINLTSQNRKKLLYLFDWQQGISVNYGKANAKDEYTALSIGHQRVKQLKAYLKKHKIVAITYNPTLPNDTLVIVEGAFPLITMNKP